MKFMERMILTYAHPARLIGKLLGAIWLLYYIWHHRLILGIFVATVLTLLGLFFSWNYTPSKFRKTHFGKLILLHLNPLNYALHVVGFIVLAYGMWLHYSFPILLGVSIMMLGHIRGYRIV